MTLLLYYSYLRRLSEDELVKIDKEVDKNRKFVYVLVKKLPLNGERKIKRIWSYMIFVFTISQPLAPCVTVIFATEIHSSYNTTQYSGDLYLTKLVSSNTTQVTTKKASGEYSIFVKGFQSLVNYLGRQKSIKVYNFKEEVEIRPPVMLQAYGKCKQEKNKLPRQIINDDKGVKFNHKKQKYKDLFKKNYEVFNFDVNLYLDNNLSKSTSAKEIDKAKDKLFREYGKKSQEFLRVKLFRNPCIIKLLDCKFATDEGLEPISVTIYFDYLTDLFAIVDKKNVLVDFGVATELCFAEIFTYKEKETDKSAQRYILPPKDEELRGDKKEYQFKALAKLKDQNIISYDDALSILQNKYGGKVIKIVNDEFEVDEWQLVKKIEHSVCFNINFADYGFTNKQNVEINQGKDGLGGSIEHITM